MINFVLIATVCLSQLCTLCSATKLTIDEQPYLSTIGNLTTTTELKAFLMLQSVIYIDNVYSAYERFFYRLLASLPKVERRTQIKLIVAELNKLLQLTDEIEKLSIYEEFFMHYGSELNEVFIYEKEQTQMTPNAFSDFYVEQGVEELLIYETQYQLQLFEAQVGNGIRLFLITNRAHLEKTQILKFREIVDRFLESSKFFEKLQVLKYFVDRAEKFLEFNIFK